MIPISLTSDQRVGGSSPSERATSTEDLHPCGYHLPTKSVLQSVLTEATSTGQSLSQLRLVKL